MAAVLWWVVWLWLDEPGAAPPPQFRMQKPIRYVFSCQLDVAACLAALFQIALVVLFGAPEGLRRLDFCDDALGLEAAFGGELLDLGAGLRLLLRRVEEDGRAVLRAPVRALAVEGGGIVQGEEGVEQLLVADLGGVEFQLDHFGVAGLVGADVPVGGWESWPPS